MSFLLEAKHDGYGYVLHQVAEVKLENSIYKERWKIDIPEKTNQYESIPIMNIKLDSKWSKGLEFLTNSAVTFLNSVVEDTKKKNARAAYVDLVRGKRGINYYEMLIKALIGIANDLTAKGYDLLYLAEGKEVRAFLLNSNLNYSETEFDGQDDLIVYAIRLNPITIEADGNSTLRPLEDKYNYRSISESQESSSQKTNGGGSIVQSNLFGS